jgi:hypothetical protein
MSRLAYHHQQTFFAQSASAEDSSEAANDATPEDLLRDADAGAEAVDGEDVYYYDDDSNSAIDAAYYDEYGYDDEVDASCTQHSGTEQHFSRQQMMTMQYYNFERPTEIPGYLDVALTQEQQWVCLDGSLIVIFIKFLARSGCTHLFLIFVTFICVRMRFESNSEAITGRMAATANVPKSPHSPQRQSSPTSRRVRLFLNVNGWARGTLLIRTGPSSLSLLIVS